MKIFKSLFSAVALVCALGVAASAEISVTQVNVTTNTPTGSLTLYTNGGYPNISGGAWLDKLVIQSSGPVLTNGQTVSVYDTCTSSMTASVAFNVYVSTSRTIGDPIVLDFPRKAYKLQNPCIAVDGATSNFKAKFFVE